MEPIKHDNQVGRTIWIKCRASEKCPGTQAEIKMRFSLPTGGTSIRYKCLTCDKPFHITV